MPVTAESYLSDHHGEISGVRMIAGFRFFDTRYRAHASIGLHSHDQACMCIVVSGHLQEELTARRLQLDVRGIAFRPAEAVHGNRVGRAGAHCLVIEVPAGWLDHVRANGFRTDEPACTQGGQPQWLGRRLYREYRIGDEASPLAVEGIMLEIAGGFSAHPADRERAVPRWLERARELLHAEYGRPLRMRDLAAGAEVHPVHLAREFRRHYGCSVGAYVRGLRIESACERLTHAHASIAQIALDTGFSSQSHFSRVFRSVTGLSPGRYRVRHQR